MLLSCSVLQNKLTVVWPLPEHLDLQLVVVVVRSGSLQTQLASGDRVKGGFRVRQRGGLGEVRGSRGGRWEGRRGGKRWWRWGWRELIGKVFAFDLVGERIREGKRREETKWQMSQSPPKRDSNFPCTQDPFNKIWICLRLCKVVIVSTSGRSSWYECQPASYHPPPSGLNKQLWAKIFSAPHFLNGKIRRGDGLWLWAAS